MKAVGWTFVVIGVACAVILFTLTIQTGITFMNTVGIISSMLTLAAGVSILSAQGGWSDEEI